MGRRLLAYISRLLMCLSLCIVFRGLKAQDLGSTDVVPGVDITYRQYAISGFVPWDTLGGSGVLWDYPWITVDSANDLTYTRIALEDAPASADYPDADVVIRRVNGPNMDYIVDQFLDQDANGIRELGSVGPVLSYVFDAPETLYGATMPLADTLSGSYCFWSDGLGIQYHFCGASYTTFDAVGTLILPYGTYTDVKHVTRWSSSLETTIPETDSSYSVSQEWFVPWVPFPILATDLFISNEGNVFGSGRIMDLASLTSIAEVAASRTLSAYPNPTNDIVTLQRTSTEAAAIEVIGADGRVVRRGRFAGGAVQHALSLEGLPAGNYAVHVVGAGSQRVVKH